MSATGAASDLKKEQHQAFTRLERPAAEPSPQQITDETVGLIREKLVDLHGQCMQQLQQIHHVDSTCSADSSRSASHAAQSGNCRGNYCKSGKLTLTSAVDAVDAMQPSRR